MALQTRRDEDKPDLYQLFGRVHNFRAEEVSTDAQLYRLSTGKSGEETKLVDAIALKIPPQTDQSFNFDLPDTGLAAFEVRLTVKDALEVDNHAFTVAGTTRKAQVLAVTPGNRYLTDTLRTPAAAERADVTIVSPEEAEDPGDRPRLERRPLRPGHLRRRQARVGPAGQCSLLRRFSRGPSVCQSQGCRAARRPRLGHRPPAHAVRARPLAHLHRPSADRRAPVGRQEPDRLEPGLSGVHSAARGLHRHRRDIPAHGRHQSQHDLVQIHQFSSIHVERATDPGQHA